MHQAAELGYAQLCQPPPSVRPIQGESPTCAAPSPWSPCACRTSDWPAAQGSHPANKFLHGQTSFPRG